MYKRLNKRFLETRFRLIVFETYKIIFCRRNWENHLMQKNWANTRAKIWVNKRLNCLKITNEQNILQY